MPEQPTEPPANAAGNSGRPHYGGPYDQNGSPFYDGLNDGPPSNAPGFDGFHGNDTGFDGFAAGEGARGPDSDPGAAADPRAAGPAEPGEPGLVPPLRVMRRRLNGVYRADGFVGPTRRYVVIVALLVALASLPTLAAITAGTATIDEGSTGGMDAPFLPPPSDGPVVRPPGPGVPGLPGAADPAGAAAAPFGPAAPSAPGSSGDRAAAVRGQASPRGTAPSRSESGGSSSEGPDRTPHRYSNRNRWSKNRWSENSDRTQNAHRSRADSRTGEPSENRESHVADRTPNSYRAGTSDRTHNSRRRADWSDNTPQTTSWSYRGSHRSERMHGADNDRPTGRHRENQHQQQRADGGRRHGGQYGDHHGPN